MIEATRLSLLDHVWDDNSPSLDSARDLFAVTEVLDSNPALRRALTDYTIPTAARVVMVKELFGAKVSVSALSVLIAAVETRWREISSLAEAIERQGVRAALLVAQQAGELDEIENALFKLGRIVLGDPKLADALDDRSVDLAARESLMGNLVSDKLGEIGQILARRAVRARVRKVALTLESYQGLAALLRKRAIIKVTSATDLSPEHISRLRVALTKQLGRAITMQLIIDPAVLGGLSVRVGDDAIEGTVAARLRQAAEEIK